jgi:hypothetical protein
MPNVVPVLSLQAFDDRTIVFGEMMVWKTRRNLEADPRLSILIVSPDLRAWTVQGRFVEFQRSGPYYDRIASDVGARYNPYGSYRSAGVIEVVSTTRAARFSQLALLTDTLRCRLLARGVSGDGAAGLSMPARVKEKFDRLKAVKAAAFLDESGYPDCIAGFPLTSAGKAHLILGGTSAEDLCAVASGASVAASVLTLEPVAYQVRACSPERVAVWDGRLASSRYESVQRLSAAARKALPMVDSAASNLSRASSEVTGYERYPFPPSTRLYISISCGRWSVGLMLTGATQVEHIQ